MTRLTRDPAASAPSTTTGSPPLTLDRPDALNSFTVTMARELEQFFRDRRDGRRRSGPSWSTGAGRAFCAGMDLSAEGNVFGLDETLSPTPEDLRDRLDEPEINAGSVTPAAR